MKLTTHYVEKPWGRTQLPAQFVEEAAGRRIGEIWFAAPAGRTMPLLVKYIFTSERLSVQVHPDDDQARARGLQAGKTECWYIIDAEPGAQLGLGCEKELDGASLKAASQDGSIVDQMSWFSVKEGDTFLVPAGTVHAIGAGISLVEVQQNSDVTYRLYDYGRPRELHLDDGVEVSRVAPYVLPCVSGLERGNRLLVEDSHFKLFVIEDPNNLPREVLGTQVWITPLVGQVRCADEVAESGECMWLEEARPFQLSSNGRALLATCPTLIR